MALTIRLSEFGPTARPDSETIERARGDTYDIEFAVLDADGNAQDLTGWTITCTVCSSYGVSPSLTSWTIGDGITVTAASGLFSVSPSTSDIAVQTVGLSVWDVELTSASGQVYTVEGQWIIANDVTRSGVSPGSPSEPSAWLVGEAVTELNSLTDDVTLAAGDGIAVSESGQTITVAASDVGPTLLDATDSPADGEVPSYDSATGQFEWISSAGGDDVQVAVDSAATAGYLGAADGEGALRADGSTIAKTDGGNYITLGVPDGGIGADQLAADAVTLAKISATGDAAGKVLKVAAGGASLEWADDETGTDDQTAAEVSYDNSSSGLTATDVQDAVDEVEGRLETAEGTLSGGTLTDDQTASEVDTTVTEFGGILSAADTTVQAALDTIDNHSHTDNDEQVAVDSGATAGYLGAASDDGVLRTSAPISYTDGGDYITLGIADAAITEAKLDIADAPSSGELLGYNGTKPEWYAVTATGGVSVLIADGAVSTGSDKLGYPLLVPYAGTIKTARLYATTAPTGAALIADVNVNGTSIWNTTQANRVQIAAGSNAGSQTSFDTTSLSAGDRITIDVDQVGSTVAGADLVLAVEIEAAVVAA